eukprot:1160295-Pelagomonas_calceolata.AAC.5
MESSLQPVSLAAQPIVQITSKKNICFTHAGIAAKWGMVLPHKKRKKETCGVQEGRKLHWTSEMERKKDYAVQDWPCISRKGHLS